MKRARGDRLITKEFRSVNDRLRRVETAVGRFGDTRSGGSPDPEASPGDSGKVGRDSSSQSGAENGDEIKSDTSGPFATAKPEVRALFEDPRPWMVDEAVALVSSALTPTMTAVEWGGGASTPYWCERVAVLHTYEASPGWALILLDYMRRRIDLIDRWRLHFVGVNWASTNAGKRRTGRSLPSEAVKSRMVADYAGLIPDSVDVVIVDGSVRQATLVAAAAYVDRDRPSVVVVDNTDKQYVLNALPDFDARGYVRYDFPPAKVDTQPKVGEALSQTSVWIHNDVAELEPPRQKS